MARDKEEPNEEPREPIEPKVATAKSFFQSEKAWSTRTSIFSALTIGGGKVDSAADSRTHGGGLGGGRGGALGTDRLGGGGGTISAGESGESAIMPGIPADTISRSSCAKFWKYSCFSTDGFGTAKRGGRCGGLPDLERTEKALLGGPDGVP